MSAFLPVFASVVGLWWLSTAAVLYLNTRPPRTFTLSFGVMTGLAGYTALQLAETAQDLSPGGAFLAFLQALILWGWLEMGFLMGFIAGPRRIACDSACRGLKHLWHAVQVILYSDLATAGLITLVGVGTRGAPNRIVFLTLLMLWVMRLSAKLNLYLGVRNLGEEMLPPHLAYLRSYFQRRPMNAFFPLAMLGGGAWLAVLCREYVRADGDATGTALLISLLILALLEHGLLIVPLRTEWLWKMALAGRR